MSNLLNKDGKNKPVKRIDRMKNVQPSNTFNPNNVFTVANQGKDQVKEKSTSVRLSTKNKGRLNALVIQEGLDSVDQVLDIILNQYESTLSPDKKRELETIIKIYSKKEKK